GVHRAGVCPHLTVEVDVLLAHRQLDHGLPHAELAELAVEVPERLTVGNLLAAVAVVEVALEGRGAPHPGLLPGPAVDGAQAQHRHLAGLSSTPAGDAALLDLRATPGPP